MLNRFRKHFGIGKIVMIFSFDLIYLLNCRFVSLIGFLKTKEKKFKIFVITEFTTGRQATIIVAS